MSDYDSIYTRNPTWYKITDTGTRLMNKHGEFEIYLYHNRMHHLPHGNNVEWIEKVGPLPYGMCYDLDCDNFFDKSGNFNFEAWNKDDDYNHKYFTCECRSFSSRSIHRCGYNLFSEVLQDGLDLWLNGAEPSENGEKIEPSFVSSLGGMRVGPIRLK